MPMRFVRSNISFPENLTSQGSVCNAGIYKHAMLMKDLQFANSYKMEWGCTNSYITTTLTVESPTLISNLVGNIKAKTKLTIINIPVAEIVVSF